MFRKIRSGGINLLGGRARTKYLHPLTCKELSGRFELFKAIERGLIPSIYFSDDPRADLQAHAGSYLQQEILAEGTTRNIPAFSRFLHVAALCNGTIVNFTNVANDAQVARTTVYEYFEILKGIVSFCGGSGCTRIANAYIMRYEKHLQNSFLRMGFQCRYLKA